jgi:hypothetical protein
LRPTGHCGRPALISSTNFSKSRFVCCGSTTREEEEEDTERRKMNAIYHFQKKGRKFSGA